MCSAGTVGAVVVTGIVARGRLVAVAVAVIDGLSGGGLVGAVVVAGAVVGGLARRVLVGAVGAVVAAWAVGAAAVAAVGGVWEASPSTSSSYCFKTLILSF